MRKRTLLVGICSSILGVAAPARAHMMMVTAPPPQVVLPTHISVGDQQFDASVSGLRAYVETTKVTEPQLYADLAPEVERLEARQSNALTAFAVGAVAGVAAGIYAVAGRSDCQEPAVTDPNFAAKAAAWGDCNDHNLQHTAAFTFIGIGAITAGGIAALVMAPKRSDIMEVVNKHNRLSPEPMRFELGYDPTRRSAYAGAAVAF
jgi:hypothetical protein